MLKIPRYVINNILGNDENSCSEVGVLLSKTFEGNEWL